MTTITHSPIIVTLSSSGRPVGVSRDASGDLLTTTPYGGPSYHGSILELPRTASGYASTPVTLASFDGANGFDPNAVLVTDANGDLLGATYAGGADDAGVVFEVTRTAIGYADTPTTLASFDVADGVSPSGGLTTDAAGDLLGVTRGGGASGQGTVFEIAKTPSGYASEPAVLASFDGPGGATPVGGLIADAAGDLFGTTSYGGTSNQGTIFELAKTATGYADSPVALASFNGADGGYPVARMIMDSTGDLFGTTPNGGAYGYGVVFELAKTGFGYYNTPAVLASLTGVNGAIAQNGLISDANGNLFATAWQLGAPGDGTVYEIAKTPSGYSSTPVTLATFNGANGSGPNSRLVADADGNLFGTTQGGGASGDGTVFEVTGSGFAPPGTGAPTDCHVWDLTRETSYDLSLPSNTLLDPSPAVDSLVVEALQPNAFIQTGTGSDILAAQAGGSNVLDDSGGVANFEMGGAGKDAYFFDAGHGPASWDTIAGFHAGDFAAIFGITPQDVAASAADGLGAAGYTGLTLRTTSQSGGPAFVTLAGYSTGALTNGSLVTAFGTDPANGRDYLLIQGA